MAQALQLLSRAFETFPDHEIAAHLGEVLWVLGEKDQARSVWRKGLEQTPDSPHILETLQRLEVDSPLPPGDSAMNRAPAAQP